MTQPENEQRRPAQDTTPERTETPEQQGGDAGRVIVVTPEGMGVAQTNREGEKEQRPAEMVEQPAKVMRVASMIKQLLEEVREAPLDEASRQRMAEIHRRSITELEAGLSQELVDELERITLPFTDAAPSEAELRVAQAQLVGWLEGLFHGIQTAIVAQQMAAQAQLQQMRRALPHRPQPGQAPHPQRPGDDSPTGQYL
ncbi:MAG TPA: bacterial proteasome activator family protein [Ornithinicoccus sp.]|jgi:hypothetical protein|nr:bacterial proteasome activator family protein [Ornithinicoccus sp.]